MTKDPIRERFLRLREDAIARGHFLAAILYGQAALERGDELIAELGGSTRFAPIYALFADSAPISSQPSENK